MNLLKLLGYLLLGAVALPLLAALAWSLWAGYESRRLETFCAHQTSGKTLEQFRSDAHGQGYAVYDYRDVAQDQAAAKDTAAPRDMDKRTALRLLESLQKHQQTEAVKTLVIARKPGIGYYACYADHDGQKLSATEFVNSD